MFRNPTSITCAVVLLCSCGLTNSSPPRPRIQLNLNGASVSALATELAQQLHRPVVIDSDAQRIAECAHVSVMTGGPQEEAAVLPLVANALQPAGLLMSSSSAGLRISHVQGAPEPRECLTYASRFAAHALLNTPSATPTEVPLSSAFRDDGLTHTISRAELAALTGTEAGSSWMREVRVVPHVANGAIDGMRLYAIRPSSLFARLGFRNGDTIYRINGQRITDGEPPTELYSTLRQARDVRVDVGRLGEFIKLHIQIAP